MSHLSGRDPAALWLTQVDPVAIHSIRPENTEAKGMVVPPQIWMISFVCGCGFSDKETVRKEKEGRHLWVRESQRGPHSV